MLTVSRGKMGADLQCKLIENCAGVQTALVLMEVDLQGVNLCLEAAQEKPGSKQCPHFTEPCG